MVLWIFCGVINSIIG
jgi:hypothetical protein